MSKVNVKRVPTQADVEKADKLWFNNIITDQEHRAISNGHFFHKAVDLTALGNEKTCKPAKALARKVGCPFERDWGWGSLETFDRDETLHEDDALDFN